MSRYVDVVITRETQPVSEQGFGLPLVLATSKVLAYKEYANMTEVAVDFETTTNEYKLFDRMFNQEIAPAKIACFGVSYTTGSGSTTALTEALDTLILSHDDWYYLVCPEHGEAEITALATWTETKDKLYGTTTTDATLATNIKDDYSNTFISVHSAADSYHGEGLVAVCAPKTIGSYTWTFKQVKGVSAASYTKTEVDEILADNATTCTLEGGKAINAKGVNTKGDYLDNIEATHFIKAKLTEAISTLLTTSDKVPYTDSGIALVVAEVEKVLKQAFDQGIIAPDDSGNPMYSITFPKRSEVSQTNLANRILPDIHWTAVIAGAIEKVEIRGVLTL